LTEVDFGLSPVSSLIGCVWLWASIVLIDLFCCCRWPRLRFLARSKSCPWMA